MIYNFSFAGATAIATPKETIFGVNKITLKNGSHYFHKMLIIDEGLTTAEMDARKLTDVYEWTDRVKAYAEFNNNLFVGNIGIDLDDVVRIGISRAEINSDGSTEELESLTATLDPSTSSWIDWTAQRDKDYYYYVFFVDSNDNTSALVRTNQVSSIYDSFFLIDPVEGISFRFNYNASSSTVSMNDGDTITNSIYSKYPIVSKPLTQFDSGTINCFLGYANSDCEYTEGIDYLDSLKSVIKNNNTKYLKNRAGYIWAIQTSGLQFLADTRINPTYPHTISFNYTQVDDVNGGD